MENKNAQILSVEAKDIISGKCAIVDKMGKEDITKLRKQNYRILSNYQGSLDYSLLTLYLQDKHKNIIKYNENKKRFYSNDIITVNFTYSLDNTYMLEDNEQYDSLLIVLDVLKVERRQLSKVRNSIKGKIKRLEAKIKDEVKNLEEKDKTKLELLKQELNIINNKKTSIIKNIYDVKDRIKFIINQYDLTTNRLREKLYKDGFIINVNSKETHFCRFLRSSGSARNGRVNFINNDYYENVIEWCMAGIDYKESYSLDLPSLEAYISLITSSIIDTFNLFGNNILLIEDAISTFSDVVMATELINQVKDKDDNVIGGDLYTHVTEKEITNKLFDGEALLDKSIFIENGYKDKAILQLRNRFYKGIGINTDIQKFFEDNNITEISQLNGVTLATDIKDIKLITTASSIKYLKYKSFMEWIEIMSDTWGICKYDKGQLHNFNGMVNTHYQLLNTLGMNKESMKELLKDTANYINLLKNDISVFKLHLGIIKEGGLDNIEVMDAEETEVMTEEEVEELDEMKTNSDFILNMLKINENFIKTKMCRKYKYEVINNYIRNVKKGHILVNGTYAVVINSAYEYLLCSIGKWDGKSSIIGENECYTKKFEVGEEILGVRSPQPTMSNMTTFKNIEAGKLADYFNVDSENIIYISAIGWNILELESSMDMDGDAMMITNNKYIISHCKKLDETIKVNGKDIKRFLVSTDFTPKKPIKRSYESKDLCVTDIKCSQGKIGECINLVQMLNSVYWTKKANGTSEEELLELYKDISNLNVLSCVIIDSAKKESPVNVTAEMDKIREKGYLGQGKITKDGKKKEVSIRPYFFKYLDGGKDYKFKKFECGMDYLVSIIDDKDILNRKDRDNENGTIQLKSLLMKQKANKADRKKIQRIIDLVKSMQIKISNVYKSKDEIKDKFRLTAEIREEYYNKISKIELTSVMVYTIIKRLSDAYTDENSKFIEYKKIGRSLLKTLYSIDTVKFLSCFLVKTNNSGILVRNDIGDIDIYDVKFKKIKNI